MTRDHALAAPCLAPGKPPPINAGEPEGPA